jgi:undecaprenol kinase
VQPRNQNPKSRIVDSFGFAFAGLRYCLRTQRNFRIHIAVAVLGTIAGLILGLGLIEWAVFATMVAMVLAAEMVNTMVESLVDLVTTEYHPLAKVAKDIAAGIVLLTAMASVIVGLLIFGPRLLALFRL